MEERLLRLVAHVLGHQVASRDRRGGTLLEKLGVIGVRGTWSLTGSRVRPASVDQPLVERERLGLTNREPAEIRVVGVQQEVVLSWDDRRRQLEYHALARFGPPGADVAQRWRSRLVAPLGGQILRAHLVDVDGVRDLHWEADEVWRKRVAVQVDELLQGRERSPSSLGSIKSFG